MKDVAVIIPAFKAHKIIKRTLSSLVTQFGVSYTVYVSVDGEPEGSYDYLLEMFDMIDLKILYKPNNGGPGMVRQFAIDNTCEPFITFIDADDIFADHNALYTMFKAFEDKDVVICTPFYREQPDGTFILRETSLLTWLHGKMYRRVFLDKYKVHFNEKYSYSNEDAGWNSTIGLISDGVNERIKQLNTNITYIQLFNRDSITNSNNNEFSRTLKNVTGFVYNKLHAFKYVVNTLGIIDDGIREAAVRSFGNIYLNYVGIDNDVPDYDAQVNELAKISHEAYYKIYSSLGEDKIEAIEKDLITGKGLSFNAYKTWKRGLYNI